MNTIIPNHPMMVKVIGLSRTGSSTPWKLVPIDLILVNPMPEVQMTVSLMSIFQKNSLISKILLAFSEDSDEDSMSNPSRDKDVPTVKPIARKLHGALCLCPGHISSSHVIISQYYVQWIFGKF